MKIEDVDVKERAFLFDFDGTLIDIALTPQAVRIPDALRQNLVRLSALAGGAVALVSGRSLDDLDRLFAPLVLPAVGGHGAEIRQAVAGKVQQHRVENLADELRRKLVRIAAENGNAILEDKGYSMALHYRLVPEREEAILNAVGELRASFQAADIEVLHGKFVVEIKRAGFDKGTGVRTLMRHPPFHGRRPIFIGDDVTDEHAFAAMPEFNGTAVSVGRDVPGTAHRFATPSDVRRWIDEICRRNAAPGRAGR